MDIWEILLKSKEGEEKSQECEYLYDEDEMAADDSESEFFWDSENEEDDDTEMIQAETSQNDEIDSADDSEPDYFGEYDNTEDDETDESATEERVFTVAPSSFEGKKARALAQLADELIWVAGLRVFEGTDILEYVEDYGYYRRVSMPEILLSKRLGPPGYFARLSAKDIRDICDRIKWNAFSQRSANQFNASATKINTETGILDFVTGEKRKHSPDSLYTYYVKARYLDEDTEPYCPVFDRFCETSLAPLQSHGEETDRMIILQKRRLLLEMIGYVCSDDNSGKCALFLKGEPDSGKSVIVNFVTRLFDSELVSSVPLHKLAGRFNKAELFGKKLNVSGEIQGQKLREISTFKSITGGDSILAEYKGKTPFTFIPRCKLLFAGNALPGTAEADATKAFLNRVVILLFNRSIPKEEQDKELLDKLWDERNAIFTLAVNALRELRERNYQFTQPDESKLFLDGFANRGNSLQTFIRDCCVLESEGRVHNVDLLEAYQRYCMLNGLEAYPKSRLYEMLSGIPGVSMRRVRIGSENRCGHVGIRLKEESADSGTMEQNP